MNKNGRTPGPSGASTRSGGGSPAGRAPGKGSRSGRTEAQYAAKEGGKAELLRGESPSPAGKSRSAAGKGTAGRGKSDARTVALDVLTRVEQDRAYSNLLLNRALQQSGLAKADAGLATELVYGTIQRLNTIDYYLGTLVPKGLDKLQPWVRNLLRLSFYQLYYLDRIPAHAIVDVAVTIAKKRGHAGISGLVNGVLRNALRRKETFAIPDGLPPSERIALEHSHPEWLVARWIAAYGEETAERICRANNRPPHASARVNRTRLTRGILLEQMREKGWKAEPSRIAPAGIVASEGGSLAQTSWFAEGKLTVQDESSMLVAEALAPEPGMRVLDCCAAPGGKTTHLAELMDDKGEIIACDIHEHKEALITEQAKRLGLTCIRTVVADAKALGGLFPEASFDRILLDAPCSGLGVIRRKPDLKWAKREEEIAAISAVQHELLAAVHRLLAPGGVLVYSTCTTEREENGGMIDRFLSEQPEFTLDPLPDGLLSGTRLEQDARNGHVQLLPDDFDSDGFFIARLRKRG